MAEAAADPSFMDTVTSTYQSIFGEQPLLEFAMEWIPILYVTLVPFFCLGVSGACSPSFKTIHVGHRALRQVRHASAAIRELREAASPARKSKVSPSEKGFKNMQSVSARRDMNAPAHGCARTHQRAAAVVAAAVVVTAAAAVVVAAAAHARERASRRRAGRTHTGRPTHRPPEPAQRTPTRVHARARLDSRAQDKALESAIKGKASAKK
jgi:hypothetical protein